MGVGVVVVGVGGRCGVVWCVPPVAICSCVVQRLWGWQRYSYSTTSHNPQPQQGSTRTLECIQALRNQYRFRRILILILLGGWGKGSPWKEIWAASSCSSTYRPIHPIPSHPPSILAGAQPHAHAQSQDISPSSHPALPPPPSPNSPSSPRTPSIAAPPPLPRKRMCPAYQCACLCVGNSTGA
ncbi:hypothetical protein DFH27DRAFT_100265 [Peziza echinospora]|nr:hypothetical protein DFH27DRAFT_100265 [Peziza echinospora]